ncbi:MAG: PPOX class F420-dependent oxidoreductase [Dehalococcoidia bacterium]|nr:PPOX class F420-dependent oxidoreductase [Dehalococcoidia bacterium]
MFTEKEIEFLKSHHTLRLATASKTGQPDVTPVSYHFDDTFIQVGAVGREKTFKYKNALENQKASFVIDDDVPADTWKSVGLKVHGNIELVNLPDWRGRAPHLRITPLVHWSWGIDTPVLIGGRPFFKRTKW